MHFLQRVHCLIVLGIVLLFILYAATTHAMASDQLLVLCYHGIQPTVSARDGQTISEKNFIDQLAYLTRQGYHFVSVQAVLDAVKHRQPLPSKPVLLSFDDGYRSFYDFVFPLLKRSNFPSVLSVVGAWIENNAPRDLTEPLMTWSQIQQVARSGLVEIASHTYDLHKSVTYNPQGNVGAIVSVRAYDPKARRYETADTFKTKITADFSRQRELFQQKLGASPRVLTWPYGRFNQPSLSVAEAFGCQLCLTLEDGLANLARPHRINRIMVSNDPIADFISMIKKNGLVQRPMRAAQVYLDLICEPDSEAQTDANLGRLIDRLTDLKINTVFVQAFSDTQGSGNIKSVYFNNQVLPVRADILSHVTHQFIIRNIQVYAWMPTLRIVFPNPELNERFQVRQFKKGVTAPCRSWCRCLTPFSTEVAHRVRMLYEDLAAHVQISGILMQDDAYLTNFEDHHPLALAQFRWSMGRSITSAQIMADQALMDQWTNFKSQALTAFTRNLARGVHKYRPDAAIARNIFPNVILNPNAELRLAQSYPDFLRGYDYVVVMAYPQGDYP